MVVEVVLLEVVVEVSKVVDEEDEEDVEDVDEVDDDEEDDDEEDEVDVVVVVTGGMQQLFESHVQSWLDAYLSLQSCEFWHIIVTLEQLPPTCGHV